MKMIEQPVFMVGSVRSGSTLLRLILDHHPDIAFNLESEYLVTQMSDAGEFPDMETYRQWLKQDRVFQHSHFSINEQFGYAELVNDFLIQKKGEKRVVGATVHYDFRKLPYLWPDAKYIYLYRDGRDVANSIVKIGFAGNAYVAADWWLTAELEWDALRRSLPDRRWMEVRYDALIGDANSELERICNFMGVEFSEAMFDYAKTSTYSVPDKKFGNQWKGMGNSRALRLLEGKMGERLVQRGYQLSDQLPIKTGPIANQLLYLHSKWGKFQHRINTFSLPLVMEEIVSRRLGLKEWNSRAIRRIDQIIDRNLR